MLNSTINGLTSLDLDELSANKFSTGTMNGDLTHIRRVEANEIIVDTRLTLTPSGVISVGNVTLSDVELTYLDGCTSNIQAQINAAANTSGLQTQITALQVSDASQNLSINALQVSDISQFTRLNNIDVLNDTQNSRLSSVEGVNASQSTAISSLQTSDNSQNTRLNNIESLNATQNSRLTAVESVNATQSSSITALQTSDSSQNTRLTNIETTNSSQDSSIATVLNRVRNITATSAITSMSKPLVFNENGEVLKFSGNQAFLASYDSADGTRHWTFGGQSSTTKNVIWNNDKNGSTTIVTGTNASNLRGRNNLNIHSNGILLNRGWVDGGNTQEYSGGIGQLNPQLSTFFVAGNGTNSIFIDPGLGSITLNSNTIWVSGQVAAPNGRYSNINMLNAAGNAFETQSSAFTETIKQQIATNQTNITTLTATTATNTTAIATNTNAITNNSNNIDALIENQTILFARLNMVHMKINLGFNLIGGPIESLADNTTYVNNTGYVFNLGSYMNANGYSTSFDPDGTSRLTKNYIMQLSVLFYHNFSNIKNFQSQIQIVQTSANIVADSTNFVGISSNGFSGNYTTQQQHCHFTTDQVPLYNSYYGIGKIFIKSTFDFTTLLGPFSMICYVRFIQTT
jgi:hypothetical protein